MNTQIDEITQAYLDASGNVGLAVGIVSGEDRESFFYGSHSGEADRPPDENTIFETGSIGKVFTGNLLAEMAQEELVGFDDPIEKHLPADVRAPTYRGQSITLENLATHTSALPRLPFNLGETVTDQDNPYANYTTEHLYAHLSKKRLWRRPGEKVKYSNLGMGLLGDILGLVDGKSYEHCVIERVLQPLGMTDTTITLSEDQQSRAAQGHDSSGKPVPMWDAQCLQGDGAHRSTLSDLLRYAEANLQSDGPLAGVLETCHQPRAGGARPLPEWKLRYGVAVLLPLAWLLGYWLTAVPGRLSHALGVSLITVISVTAWFLGTGAGLLSVLLLFGGMGLLGLMAAGGGPIPAGMKAGIWKALLIFGGYSWALSRRFRTGANLHIGLAWHRSPIEWDAPIMIWHNGATGGFATFIGLIKETRTAVVVLSNCANCVDDVAIQILRAIQPAQAAGKTADD